jgi:phosphate transport system permease protein
MSIPLALGSPAMVPGTVDRRSRLRTRRAKATAFWGACGAALLLVALPVVSIVAGIASHAVAHWKWSILTTTTSGTSGGLANAIVGTVVIVAGVALMAGALGIAGGVYLAELSTDHMGSFLRGASEVLAGIPSIVLGYVGYMALVVALGWGFSLAAALVVLSVLVVPYVMKSTEVAIRQVPTSYREGAEALGMRTWQAMRKVVMKPALPGIVTGLIVSLAIAVGETAPLIYTAEWSNGFPTLQLTHSPIAYLPYAVWTFFNQPYTSAQELSYVAALLLIALVLVLIVVSRLIVSVTQRYSPQKAHRSSRSLVRKMRTRLTA